MADLSQFDSTLAAAIAQADYPQFLIDDLINSGGLRRVHRRINEQRAIAPVSIAQAAAILDHALAELSAEGLAAFGTEKHANGSEQTTRLFPVTGGDELFPDPMAGTPAHLRRTPGTEEPPAPPKPSPNLIDRSQMQDGVRLLRAEALLLKWREGKVSDTDAMDALRDLLADAANPEAETSD